MTSKHYHRRKQPDEPVRNKYQKKKEKGTDIQKLWGDYNICNIWVIGMSKIEKYRREQKKYLNQGMEFSPI